MSLFSGPAEHAANPPESWQVARLGRVWQLRTAGGGVLDSYPTKRAAEAARADSNIARLYAKETRWYAGEPVDGWKPYVPPAGAVHKAAPGARPYPVGTRRCEQNAVKGTGYGTCDRVLDQHGGCDRAASHVDT